MKRLLKLSWAFIRCHAYLCKNSIQFAARKCELEMYFTIEHGGETVVIATLTGCIFKGDKKIKRVFWNETDYDLDELNEYIRSVIPACKFSTDK